MDHQPEVPGKSITDLLTQVILRVAGPEPRNPYSRQEARQGPDFDDRAEDGDVDDEWVHEDDVDAPSGETEASGDEEPDDDNGVDDTGRGRRRDDDDLFRI
jgi:hypothetical protein